MNQTLADSRTIVLIYILPETKYYVTKNHNRVLINEGVGDRLTS